ncbi:MAG: FAD-binding oxidoreductase [Spirochaetes bacterium]|nr:FAD-binding oxidoreductase [Spirochaetota bacterium]MBU1080598.1 FAD-binding oxidoreductase [Spirochaetota bacterium]
MALKTDAVVLGAGVNGLAIAYELCRRGKSVILADASVMGAGASGSCDDMILLQSKKPGILLEMTFRSLELFKALTGDLPCDIEFETRGGTILIEDAAQLAVMEDFVASQKRSGLAVEIIDAARLRRLQPHVSAHVIASTYSADDSQVNPMQLMKGFMLGAQAKGLRYLSRTRPEAIERRAGHWSLRMTGGESIEAEVVVNATGAYANSVCRLLGFELPIAPRKGQVLVTEQLPALGETNVWSAQYIVSKLKPELAKSSAPGAAGAAARFGLGFAFTGTHNGNYLIGSTREDAGFDKATDPDALSLIAAQARKFFPVIAQAQVIRSFAGLRPSTFDGMPFLGEVPDRPGFFMAAGHEGDGIAMAPITGRFVADLACGKTPEFDATPFRVERAMRPQGAAHGA